MWNEPISVRLFLFAGPSLSCISCRAFLLVTISFRQKAVYCHRVTIFYMARSKQFHVPIMCAGAQFDQFGALRDGDRSTYRNSLLT
jgi:hypothetical protein